MSRDEPLFCAIKLLTLSGNHLLMLHPYMKAAAKLKLPTNQPPIPQRVQLLRDSPRYGPIPQGQGRRDFGSKTRVRKIRLGRSRRNSNGYRTMQEFICSCQVRFIFCSLLCSLFVRCRFLVMLICSATQVMKPAFFLYFYEKLAGELQEFRRVISSYWVQGNGVFFYTGCKVMVRLLRSADHGWYVSMLELSHYHEVSKACGEKKQWNSHSKIDPLTKDFIRKLRENNICLGRVCSVLGVNSKNNGLPVRKQVIRSACATIAQGKIKDDIGKTLRVLEDMKRADPVSRSHATRSQ